MNLDESPSCEPHVYNDYVFPVFGDMQVMTRHRQLDPLCPLITDPNQTDNVPNLENAATSPQPAPANDTDDDDDDDLPPLERSHTPRDIEEPDNRGDATVGNGDVGPDYMNEQYRLDTFTNWPVCRKETHHFENILHFFNLMIYFRIQHSLF